MKIVVASLDAFLALPSLKNEKEDLYRVMCITGTSGSWAIGSNIHISEEIHTNCNL